MAQNTGTPLTNSLTASGSTNTALSVYNGELSREVIVQQCRRLKLAFPKLDRAFFELLVERVTANGFCNERLIDAVNNLIDTCEYVQPMVAAIINYDKQVKLFTYEQMLQLAALTRSAFDHYLAVDNGGPLPMWAHRNDVEKFRLKRWKA